MEIIEHLKNGAYDMILPKNLADDANSIMNFELSEDMAEVGGLHKNLESSLNEASIDEQLSKLSSGDTLSKLLLHHWHPKLV